MAGSRERERLGPARRVGRRPASSMSGRAVDCARGRAPSARERWGAVRLLRGGIRRGSSGSGQLGRGVRFVACFELEVHQFLVDAPLSHQFVVRAGAYDGSILEHNDLVGPPNRRQPVCDYENGTALAQRFDGLLNRALGFGVQGGSGFVTDQDRGVLEQRTSNRDSLSLAAREF